MGAQRINSLYLRNLATIYLKNIFVKMALDKSPLKLNSVWFFYKWNYKTKTGQSFTNCSEEKEPVDSVGI